MTKATVIFNIRDTEIIENLPKFEYAHDYPPLSRMELHEREWGRVGCSDGDYVRFLGFDKFSLDCAVALTGGQPKIESQERGDLDGAIVMAYPTHDYLTQAALLLMHHISSKITEYPPRFKMWTEANKHGQFMIRYQIEKD